MANDEFYLPQVLIQRIQSFLNAREHAQSSILSKSWYISYPTRPVLALVETGYSSRQHDFFALCYDTLNMYKSMNQKVDKFKLLLNIRECDFSRRYKLAGELITSALTLGMTEIELRSNSFSQFNLRYYLPAQVFASTSLTCLSVTRYVIGGVIGDRVLCSCLKSLVLDKVKTTGNIVQDILARCPLIENLYLCLCVGLEKLNVSKLTNLVKFRVVDGSLVKVEFMDLDRMNETKFCCLRRLQLEKVRIDAEFFTRFSSLFPCVEDLSLGYCGDYEEINISSHSLGLLRLNHWKTLKRVQLNVPNISKFEFEAGWGDTDINEKFKPLPSLSFDNVSKEWESDVHLWWKCDVNEACWFEDLRKFLNQLNLSRISLLQVIFSGKSVVLGKEIPSVPDTPVVEKLKVCAYGSHESYTLKYTTQRLLLGFSKICCPNLITGYDDREINMPTEKDWSDSESDLYDC